MESEDEPVYIRMSQEIKSSNDENINNINNGGLSPTPNGQ